MFKEIMQSQKRSLVHDAIEEVIEPFLIQQGLVQRTPRGRVVTARGFSHIGLKPDKEIISQLELLSTQENNMLSGEGDEES